MSQKLKGGMPEDEYNRLFPSSLIEHESPRGWIQWKGTQVCMDIHCACGEMSHIDCDFTYHIKCPYCNQVYECDPNIILNPIDFEPENTKTCNA